MKAVSNVDIEPEQTQHRMHKLISDAGAIRKATDDASSRCKCLRVSLAKLESEKEGLLQAAAPAMDALVQLIKKIELLDQFTQDHISSASLALDTFRARTPLVNACKAQCRVVFDQFQSLSDKARGLMKGFAGLSVDFTYEVSLAKTRIERLRNLQEIARTLRKGIENERQSVKNQMETAEEHSENARAVIHTVEKIRKKKENARVFRDIVTFGIGKALDLFDLEKDIKHSEKTFESTRKNLQVQRQSVKNAVVALRQIDNEIMCLDMLGKSAHEQGEILQQSMKHCQEFRTRTIDLANASLGVSLFVGSLAAKSETLGINSSAQQLAQSMLSFKKVMITEGKLDEVPVHHQLEVPVPLQRKLRRITRSDIQVQVGNSNGAQMIRDMI